MSGYEIVMSYSVGIKNILSTSPNHNIRLIIQILVTYQYVEKEGGLIDGQSFSNTMSSR